MYTKDKVPGLITPTSNMVAPLDESTTDDGWKIVRTRKTLRKFNRDFPKYTSLEANPPNITYNQDTPHIVPGSQPELSRWIPRSFTRNKFSS